MKIAVTSQNRRDVTEHAGRCRNFWVFEVDGLKIVGRSLLELPREASFHDAPKHGPHPLDDVDLLITGGMGEGLRSRLARRGIEALVTIESQPDVAVQAWLAGRLPTVERRASESGEHGHRGHGRDHDHACTCAGGGCGCH
jgi:predicted Fe-Mo cluster-binding NifX family protein